MKNPIIGATTLKNLSPAHQGFLKAFTQTIDPCAIPLYVENDNGLTFIFDFGISGSENEKFEKKAPPGLLRGGAVIKIISRQGILVIPDERYHWFRLFGGVARFNEWHNLQFTGGRELSEEVFVYDLKKNARYVPIGYAQTASNKCGLDFNVKTIEELGRLELIDYKKNYSNKCIEAILKWDISTLNNFSVNLEEEWGISKSGISVYAINNQGKIMGIFSGQQGFVEFPKFSLHKTLEAALKMK